MALGQWLALTPEQIFEDTLNITKENLAKVSKEKGIVVQ